MGRTNGFERARHVRTLCAKTGASLTAAAAFVALGMLASTPAFAATGGTTVTTPQQVVNAFNHATSAGSTITLGGDITVDGTDIAVNDAALSLGQGDALTIDLNGHTLTVTGAPADTEGVGQDGIDVDGNLTISGGTLVATGGVGGAGTRTDSYAPGTAGPGNLGGDGVALFGGTLTLNAAHVTAHGGTGGPGGVPDAAAGARNGGNGGPGGYGMNVRDSFGVGTPSVVRVTGGSLAFAGGAGGTGGAGAPGSATVAGGNGGNGGGGDTGLVLTGGSTLGVADAAAPQMDGGAGGNGGNGGQPGNPGGTGGAGGGTGEGFDGSSGGEVPGPPTASVTFDAAGCGAPTHTFTAYTVTVGQAEQIMNTMLPGWPAAPNMTQNGWFPQKTGGAKADPTAQASGQTLHAQCTPLPAVIPVAPTVSQAECTTSGTPTSPTVTTPTTADVTYTFDDSHVLAGSTVTVTAKPATGFQLGEAAGWTADAANGTATYTVTLDKPACTTPTPTPMPTSAPAAVGPSVHTGGTVSQAADGTSVAPWLAVGAAGILIAGGSVLMYRRRTHRE